MKVLRFQLFQSKINIKRAIAIKSRLDSQINLVDDC
jgi:hypothetical protein